MMIMTYSYEKMHSENANFRINMFNNAFSLLMEYGITHTFSSKFWRMFIYSYILKHFWYSSEVYMVSENVNEVRWHVVPRYS